MNGTKLQIARSWSCGSRWATEARKRGRKKHSPQVLKSEIELRTDSGLPGFLVSVASFLPKFDSRFLVAAPPRWVIRGLSLWLWAQPALCHLWPPVQANFLSWFLPWIYFLLVKVMHSSCNGLKPLALKAG